MVAQLHDKGFVKNIKPWTRGIDRDIYKPAKRSQIWRKYFQNNEPMPIMLNVSRVSVEKNLEAFYQMPVEGTKIQVGDGPKLEYYKKKYPEVHFVGAKRGKDLAKYYQQADVFVFPSKWDTFGIVQIEAMACGTPVAAYPVQGPIDVIDNNVTGVIENDLTVATKKALDLDRQLVYNGSIKWSWERAWQIFKDNLVELK
jgi:glycosyltransferase involved in cell wall biosynthesis